MEITTTYEGDAATITPVGHLNTNTSGELERELARTFEKSNDVVLDFSQVEYLSSAGLRVLVGAQKQMATCGGSLRIVNLIDEVREVFEITGLIDVMNVE